MVLFIEVETHVKQELDTETKLYLHGARYRDPRTCGFISVDPLIINFTDINAERNLYGYARANPLMYSDPIGLDTEITISEWNVPIPRLKGDATKFTFVINLTNEFLSSKHSNDTSGFTIFENKLKQFS